MAAITVGLGPLRLIGVNPERVSLMLTLMLRAIPVLTGFAAEVDEALRARGARRTAMTLSVPLIIRTLRHADRTAEALQARGVGEEDPRIPAIG
jgi:biotin transport system permease protein